MLRKLEVINFLRKSIINGSRCAVFDVTWFHSSYSSSYRYMSQWSRSCVANFIEARSLSSSFWLATIHVGFRGQHLIKPLSLNHQRVHWHQRGSHHSRTNIYGIYRLRNNTKQQHRLWDQKPAQGWYGENHRQTRPLAMRTVVHCSKSHGTGPRV